MEETTPQASVVFATHNRARRLQELIAALRAQTVAAAAFEVVIVDDASTDETPAVLAAAGNGDLRIRTIRHDLNRGPAAARNTGWRSSRAEFVVFTDDDCVPTPGWLEAALEAHRRQPDAIVQGRTDPRPDELDQLGAFARTLTVHQLGPFFQTCNVAYPRALLERLGGFDEHTFTVPGGEDADLAWSALTDGVPAVFAADAQTYHAVTRLGPLGHLRVAWRWTETMRIYARYPELRRANLLYGVFWKGTHYLLVRAMVGLLLPPRARLLANWLSWPYLAHLVGDRWRSDGGSPLLAPYYALHDLVELVAVLRGAARYRVFVL